MDKDDSLVEGVPLSRLRKRIENHLLTDSVLLPAPKDRIENVHVVCLSVWNYAWETMSNACCERNERNCVDVQNLNHVVVSRSPSVTVPRKEC